MNIAFNKRKSYRRQITAMFGTALIGYWPFSEASGTTIQDASGNGRTGTYTSATVANATSPGGKPCPAFNGTSTIANVYSAGLAGAFSALEGSLAIWVKATAQSNWTDATARTIATFQVDTNNQVVILKNAANSLRIRYTAGATISGTQLFLIAPASWAHIAITWSKSGDSVKLYYNGVLQTSFTGLGTWAGSLASAGARFGANATPAQYWIGWMADAILLNRAMTAAEVARLAYTAPNLRMPKISYIGDSITADANDVWVDYVQNNYNSGSSAKINHAAGGATIATEMDGQVTASATDGANIIILALGTNDNDAGDMTALQAEVEENIAELKLTNAGARMYFMNVLPKWTDSTGATPIDKSHIRTAIAAACTSQSITCWDTFTSPWITAAQTSDGTHPTSAGHQAIATQVLARL